MVLGILTLTVSMHPNLHVQYLKGMIQHTRYDGWNMSFLLGWPIFGGELLVSGSVSTNQIIQTFQETKDKFRSI